MKKKILYLGNKLAIHGNNKTTVDTLASLFAKEGYSVASYSDKKNQFLRLLDMLGATIREGRNSDYILIDTYSTLNFWYAFICSQIARLFNIRYIPILHGGNLSYRLEEYPFFSKLMFKKAYMNVAPSGFIHEKFNAYNYFNVVYIPNIVEVQNYSFKERNEFQPKLLWVRAFDAIYNPEMAITVFNEIKHKYPQATLCMVGPNKDGSLEKMQQKAASLKLEVVFTGKLSREEWCELSKDYDIFINTTHFDNRPVSVMEAMTLGLAVVSTNVGGLPYLIESNNEGLLVNDNDVSGMVNAICEIVEDSFKSKQFVTNAYEKVITYDWNIVKHQWEKLLN